MHGGRGAKLPNSSNVFTCTCITRISADASSSYFDLYCSGLEPERYYTVLIKTVIGGVTKVFDEDIMFKVSKG